MKKLVKLCCVISLTVIMVLGSACNNVTGFELPHFDGSNQENGYDTDLTYKNKSNMLGGDSGVIWVSKEQGGEEFGGYFYQYMSETRYAQNQRNDGLSGSPYKEDGTPAKTKREASYIAHLLLSRSKDLNNWEVCGAVNGMALKLPAGHYEKQDDENKKEVDENKKEVEKWVDDCWIGGDVWAPECIFNPVTEQYYLYFNATYGGERKGNMFGAVAVSDSPVGPFELVTSEHYKSEENPEGKNPNGEVLSLLKPQFDFQRYLGEDHLVHRNYIADFSPFIDENGDLYMYYIRRTALNEKGEALNGLSTWGMKMKDFATPDYSTISLVIMHESSKDRDFHPVKSVYKGETNQNLVLENGDIYQSAEGFINDPDYPRWDVNSWEHREMWSDGTKNTEYLDNGSQNPDFNGTGSGRSGSVDIREGVQVFTNKDKNGKTVYYAKTTFTGVQSAQYDEHWLYSYSPLGNNSFEYPKDFGKGTILGVDQSNDFMSNLGHSQIINVDGEWWISHWEWSVPFFTSGDTDIGRIQAITQMTWVYDDKYPMPIPVANGPSKSLQPLPSIYTGYRNVSDKATITATNCTENTIKYLNDGLVVSNLEWEEREFVCKKNSKITLKFDQPQAIKGIFVYNSYNKYYAFNGIESIQFKLAEKPSWYSGESYDCYIEKVGFDCENYYPAMASVVTFNEIKVNEITIKVGGSLTNGDIIHLSDICVLGK